MPEIATDWMPIGRRITVSRAFLGRPIIDNIWWLMSQVKFSKNEWLLCVLYHAQIFTQVYCKFFTPSLHHHIAVDSGGCACSIPSWGFLRSVLPGGYHYWALLCLHQNLWRICHCYLTLPLKCHFRKMCLTHCACWPLLWCAFSSPQQPRIAFWLILLGSKTIFHKV